LLIAESCTLTARGSRMRQHWLRGFSRAKPDSLHDRGAVSTRNEKFADPKTYTKPWTVAMSCDFYPDTELIESICENQKDRAHIVGR